MAIGNSRVLVDGPGRNSFDDGEVYVGASDGVYVDRFHVGILELVNCLLVQCRHTSIVPVNCNGLERARRPHSYERAGVSGSSVSTILSYIEQMTSVYAR